MWAHHPYALLTASAHRRLRHSSQAVEHKVVRSAEWVAETQPRVLRIVELAAHSLQSGGPSGPPPPLLRCAAADFAFRLSLAGGAGGEAHRQPGDASPASPSTSSRAAAGGGAAPLAFFDEAPVLTEMLLALCADSWPQVRLLAASHLRQLSALAAARGPEERSRLSSRASDAMLRSLAAAADAAAAIASGGGAGGGAGGGGGPGREAVLLLRLRTVRGAWEVFGPELASFELGASAEASRDLWGALGRILAPSGCWPAGQRGPAGAAGAAPAVGRGLLGQLIEFRSFPESVRAACSSQGEQAPLLCIVSIAVVGVVAKHFEKDDHLVLPALTGGVERGVRSVRSGWARRGRRVALRPLRRAGCESVGNFVPHKSITTTKLLCSTTYRPPARFPPRLQMSPWPS